ncbi:MAG: folate-binding protein YgfZ [Betaproteobacteria bacterium]|nr:folate-binding protein YgfZ [Betaproteobacteria bacterium]
MNPNWQSYLAGAGAVFEQGHVAHFGDPARERALAGNAMVLADLSGLGLIRFTGPDSQSFLQGQLTNDVREASPRRSQYSAYCTPKGRALASLLLWGTPDGYLMQLPSAIREAVQSRLSRFVLRAKVTLSDASDTLVRLGLAGAHAPETLLEAFGEIPRHPHDMVSTDAHTILCLEADRFELVLAPERAPAVWQKLCTRAAPVGMPCWEWLDIRAGVPAITPPTQEAFVPQMLNFDRLGGVSFQKGCYPGQEIVARTKYLGKLKRRMYRAHVPSETAVLPGDELYAEDVEDQASGTIVNAAPAPAGGYDVLAVAQIESAQTRPLHWKTRQGPVLEVLPLPYPAEGDPT